MCTSRLVHNRGSWPRPLLAALALLLATGAAAQVTPLGSEFQVNTHTNSYQDQPAVAVDREGGFVVVWGSYGQDGAVGGIFAKRFAASGGALAIELQVNTRTLAQQDSPSIALDADGDFVVVWTSLNGDGPSAAIFGRRFAASGVPQAPEFQVNTYTFGNQLGADVASDAGGNFVVSWTSADGPSYGVFARRFAASGIGLATEFQVNTYTTGHQQGSAVALDGDGDFVIAWRSQDQDGPSGNGVFARRFASSGGSLGKEFQVNTYTSGDQNRVDVAMRPEGDFVAAWTSVHDGSATGIFARRFAASGTALGHDFQVNVATNGGQSYPVVTLDRDGDFAVAWESSGDGSIDGVFARRFDSTGLATTADFQVNTYTTGSQRAPAAAAEAGGDFVVAWTSAAQDGSNNGVFAQRFTVPKLFDIDGNGSAEPLTDGLLFLRYFFGFRGATLINSVVALNCARCTQGPLESYLDGLADMTSAAPAGSEFQVSAYTTGAQITASAAAAATGNVGFIVAWTSPQDGSSSGIIARRFDPNGVPLAPELQVNDFVTGYQGHPDVAAGGNDFVVAWESAGQDGAGRGVFARRFGSAGTPLATEFQVAVRTASYQTWPTVAMNATRAFVVAWSGSNQDGDEYGIFARRFNSAGTALGGDLEVNNHTAGSQTYPAAAIEADGDFIVVWQSAGQDGGLGGVFGRRFSSAGTYVGGEFRVNAHTPDYQGSPAIAVNPAGGFIVSWSSTEQDGDAVGVFARRFDAAGVAQAVEFQANVATEGIQGGPAIAIESGGSFVVAWNAYAQPGDDGSGYGVFARLFDAAGVARGAEFQVNTYVTDYQKTPSVAMRASGDFLVAWQSDQQDGSGYGVFGQRYAAGRAADIDGDGDIEPLTDGVLLLRYLFGFRGSTLVSGAVDLVNCTRCDAAAIESFVGGKV